MNVISMTGFVGRTEVYVLTLYLLKFLALCKNKCDQYDWFYRFSAASAFNPLIAMWAVGVLDDFPISLTGCGDCSLYLFFLMKCCLLSLLFFSNLWSVWLDVLVICGFCFLMLCLHTVFSEIFRVRVLSVHCVGMQDLWLLFYLCGNRYDLFCWS